MIDRATYQRIRARFQADGEITPDLYAVLIRLARVVVFAGRLPPGYSPTGSWDTESAVDAAHGWIERRLLRTNALLAAFDLAEEPRPFLRSLERNFRHYLENERERGELGNLVSRTGAMLREEDIFRDWVPQEALSNVWWGLAKWDQPDPYQGADRDLVAQAWALGDVQIFRYSQSVERASPVLSTDVLREFLTGLFERVGFLLTIAHLAGLYAARFDLGDPVQVELMPEHADELPESERPPDDEIRAAAAAFVAELPARRLESLLLKAREHTLEQIAESVGVSRGTVDNELKRAATMLDKHCVAGIKREQILEKVLDSLSLEGDKTNE